MRAPELGFGSAQMRPPCASIMARAKYNPKPAPLVCLTAFGRTIEAVKDVRQVLRVDAGTFIAYANDHLPGPHRAANLDLAFRRVFQGVGNQIRDHLLNARFIGKDDGKFIREVGGDRVLLGLSRKPFGDAVQLRRGVKRQLD